eukprot:5076862-Prymnesium_polylepis.1
MIAHDWSDWSDWSDCSWRGIETDLSYQQLLALEPCAGGAPSVPAAAEVVEQVARRRAGGVRRRCTPNLTAQPTAAVLEDEVVDVVLAGAQLAERLLVAAADRLCSSRERAT